AVVPYELDVRVHLRERVVRGVDLAPTDVAVAVEDLAREVRRVDDVEIIEQQPAHAGGREIKRGGRAEPAEPDDERARAAQARLPLGTEALEREMPCVTDFLPRRHRRSVPGESVGAAPLRRDWPSLPPITRLTPAKSFQCRIPSN